MPDAAGRQSKGLPSEEASESNHEYTFEASCFEKVGLCWLH